MAVPGSAFSIREYALKMRGKDLTRSWPFSENVKEEVAEALLPPISVTKFRWWSHEMEILKSNNCETEKEVEEEEEEVVEEIKMEKICPVCGVFVTATVNAMNAHIDNCLAQTTKERRRNKAGGGFFKAKSRTPKKRSIAEIFAVAPPVETMIIVNDCEGEKVVGKQKIRDKLKATSLARTLVSAMKTIKANKTKNKYKKKKSSKMKNKDFGHEQLCKKGQRNHKDVSVRCKKPCFKLLSSQKKQKLVKKSNVVAMQQRPAPQIRSILKHSVKVVSETNPSSTNLKCSDQVINNGGQKSDRRVSFLDKDDVLGPSTRAFSDTFEQNDGSPFQASEGNTNSGESNKGVDSMEVGVNDDDVVRFSTRHEVDSQHVKGKIQLPNIHDQVNAQCSMRPYPSWDNANHSAEKLISANRVIPHESNLHLFDHVYVDAPQKLPSVDSAIPALLAAQEERQYGHVRTQCGSSFPRAHSFYGKSVDHLINPINGVAALSSMTSTVPSFPLSENAVGRFLNLAESSAKDTGCHFPNWEQSAVANKEKGANDGFFCLPLNSKGELIQLNSGSSNRFDQMNEASNNMACSSRIPVCGLVLPRSTRDYFIDNEKLLVDTELTGNQLTLFPLHSNMQENQNQYLSGRFDVAEHGTSETADIRLLNSERGTESGRFFHSNLMDPPFNRCRYYGKLQNQNVSAEIYPENSSSILSNPARQTMRLMGKDVAVGGNGKEVQEPGVINFWKNSTLIENCLTNPIQENPMRKSNFLQERVFYPAGFHGNQVAQRNLLPNAPQVRYPHPRLDRKSSIMYPRSDSVINLNERFNNIHAFAPLSTEVFNMAPNFQAPFISGPETLRFGSQPSAFSSTSHHMYPNRYENSFELGFNQNNLHPAKLGTFNFPFLQPDDENHVQLPWFHSSNRLPPWMLHGHQREEALMANSKLADINGYYYPFISSGTDVLISPPTHHRHEAAYRPCSTMPSHLQMKNNIPGSTSFFQPIPVAPRVQSPSIRMKTLSVKDSDHSSKKRPAGELVDSRKRQKVSSLEMNNAGVVPGWTRGKFIDDVQSNPGMTAKIHANWDKAVNSAGNISNVTQTDGVVISTTNEPPKVECMARSGPIKLTAGAKHILKPSQSMDLDNTKPTYLTIPSAGLAHSVSLAESQKKSTKVYSF